MTDLLALAERVDHRLASFGKAVDELCHTPEALAKGYQFNAYDSADNSEDEPDDSVLMLVCLGPITDALLFCRVVGREKANMIADALTIAAALRARHHLTEQANTLTREGI